MDKYLNQSVSYFIKFMAKVGRPTKYKPEMCDIVVELMMEGASKTEVMAELGIWRETFYRWVNEKPEFSDTLKKGQQLSQAWWERNGRINLENKQFNYTGWYMNMKNRFDWSDRNDIRQTGNVSLNVVTGIDRAPND